MSEIVVTFEDVPLSIYERPDTPQALNRLVIQLAARRKHHADGAGEESRRSDAAEAVPEPGFPETFKTRRLDAYERLLTDVVKGNLTLFMRRDELDAAWAWIDPIREAWASSDEPPKSYTAGSWGPAAASSC